MPLTQIYICGLPALTGGPYDGSMHILPIMAVWTPKLTTVLIVSFFVQSCTGVHIPPLPHTGPTTQHSRAVTTVVIPWSWTKLPTRTVTVAATTSHTVPS